MKILLIIPRYNLTNKANYEYMFPFGLGYISSVLKQEGHKVDCLNLNHMDGTIENLTNNALDKKEYDFACTGHLGMGYAIIEKIINIIHNHKSKTKVILGGALITSEPKPMFNALNPDIAVIGEGETTIIELLNYLKKEKDISEVNGICYKNKNGDIVLTKPREVISNLDSLPLPDFEGFGFKEQLENQSNNALFNAFDYPRPYPILGSRGCPYQCTFCYHTTGIKYRTRSINNILEEIEQALEKYKVNAILLYDDLFSIDRERLAEFCVRIKKLFEKVDWECKWMCQLSVNKVDKEMLEMLKDAGCNMISFGFESYSPAVLKSMKKPITPEQINKAIELTMEVGIAIQGCFIFGDIAETKETAKETLNYWKKNCRGQVSLGFIQPYPGSAIYEHCMRKGIIKDKLDFIKNNMNHTNWFNMTDAMTDEDIKQLKKDLLDARRNYVKYARPLRLKKDIHGKYELDIKCPYCNKKITYGNCNLPNKYHYSMWTTCRSCNMRFFIVSLLKKIETKHYEKLDFLRRNYLSMRDKMLRRKL